MNVAIVGLGLIGGSLAKSLKSHTAHTVFGYDINGETMLMARMCGAVDGTLDSDVLSQCDIVFLALNPDAAITWICENGSKLPDKAVVTDMCGVKAEVCPKIAAVACEYGFTYVGGHPMAGREHSKFISSCDTLFDGAPMILTPDKSTRPDTLEMLGKLFLDIGFSRVVYTTPEEHDSIIALTSQLAHIVSSAYVKSPEAQKQRGFSAGSFRDMTRVACLDEHMWTELFFYNRENVTMQLHTLMSNLNEYLDALESNDKDKMQKLLADGKEKKLLAGGF